MSSQVQDEAGREGRSFTKSFQIYKPRREGGGCASQWELSSGKGAVFLEMAAQVGKMEGDENARFDWSNKLTMKLGITDLGEIIACLEGRQMGIGPFKEGKHRGLFHKSAKGTASLRLDEAAQGPGWHLKIGVQQEGAAVENLSHSITPGEGAALLVLLRVAVERIYGW
jgi:hypothetical protein